MRTTYFGVRGSCPCSSDQYRRYGGNTSCVLVEAEGEAPLILDLGTGLRALGDQLARATRVEGAPLRANALLTHLHYDHVLGLPFFAPLRDPGAVLDIYGPAQLGGPLGTVMAEIVQPPFFPIHLGDFSGDLRFHDIEGNVDLTLGKTVVKVRSVPHIGHTLGFRIEADGHSLAYLSDHQAPLDRRHVDEGVLELCDGADLVIHDAQYTDEEFSIVSHWGHSTVAYALHVATEAGAKHLSLFHHDPAHADKQIDRMLRDVQRIASKHRLVEVSAAAEGDVLDLGKL